MRFEDPWLLLLLMTIPAFLYWTLRGEGSSSIRFSSVTALKRIKMTRAVRYRKVLVVLRCAAVALLVLAAARPQGGRVESEVSTEGVDIMLALDTSESMLARDFEIGGRTATRLDVVKEKAEKFIRNRQHDRVGMVVFGAQAFTQCPLTLDHGILLSFLDRLEAGMAGAQTAVGSALGTCVNRLKDLEAESKIIILLTDGRNNSGRIDPITAAEIARTYGIRIHTIGVGTRGKAPFLVDTLFGQRLQWLPVELDEETLKQVAQIAGGQYFRATDSEGLEEIYNRIDEMETTEVKVGQYTEYDELFAPFLLAGTALLLAEILLGNTRFRKIP